MDVLGIGANMVKSLRYWLQATRLSEEPNAGKRNQSITDIGKIIYGNDPYFEETGSLWLVHYGLATNQEHDSIFAGECKYYDKPVPADVYFDLKKKCGGVQEFCGKHIIYGIFSKSGFEQRLLDAAKENPDLYLFDQGERIL